MSFFKRLFGKKKNGGPTQEVTEEVVEEIVEELIEEIVEEVIEEDVEKTTNIDEETVDTVRYEIKPHKEEGWQVIKVGASRARRRFSTQAECINYCKGMKYKFDLFGKDGEPR